MTRVWFVMPVFGREELTAVSLRQLRRTCDAADVDATVVVIGDDSSLDVAHDLGFATVRRDNEQLGRKFNDGFQLACDETYNPDPADYVIPVGSDNWIDPVILRNLPGEHAIGVFREQAVVNEDRTKLARLRVGYKTGTGIRIIPRGLLGPCGYRPAAEDRGIALDSSIYEGIRHANVREPALVWRDVHPLQIVGLKSRSTQLHPYSELAGYRRGPETDPWPELAQFYPEAVAELRAAGA